MKHGGVFSFSFLWENDPKTTDYRTLPFISLSLYFFVRHFRKVYKRRSLNLRALMIRIEGLSFTYTANVRFKLRISQQRK